MQDSSNFRFLVGLVQCGSALGPRKDLLHRADRVRIDNDHPRLSCVYCLRKCAAKFFRRLHSLGSKSECASDGDIIGALKIDSDGSSIEMRILDVSQHAVCLIIEQYNNNWSVLLARGSQF